MSKDLVYKGHIDECGVSVGEYSNKGLQLKAW